MAEEIQNSVPMSEVSAVTLNSPDLDEPVKKKIKTGDKLFGKSDKLEHRLGGILCCAVCLDLPRAAIYQVCAKSADRSLVLCVSSLFRVD